MSSTPQDLPTLTADERRVHDIAEHHDRGFLTLTVPEVGAVVRAFEELDAYRQADAGITASPAVVTGEPTWQQAAEAVAARLRILAVDIGPDVARGDDDHLEASAMRHLAAILPMLEARAGSTPGEAALAIVVMDARAVVASVARNGVTGEHMVGILEPVGDAIRALERSLDELPGA